MNAVTLMCTTSMPARRAASSLPPVAYRCRPHVVLVSAIVHTIISAIGDGGRPTGCPRSILEAVGVAVLVGEVA